MVGLRVDVQLILDRITTGGDDWIENRKLVTTNEIAIGSALCDDIGELPFSMTPHTIGRVFLSTVYIEFIRLGLGRTTCAEIEAGLAQRLAIIHSGLAAQTP